MWLTILKASWKPALIGLAAVLALGGLLYVRALRADNARLAAEAAMSAAAADRTLGALMAGQKALAQRQAENEKLAGERDEALAELEKLYETDNEACDWAAGRVPNSVFDRLCR
jgi:hypothetical protein